MYNTSQQQLQLEHPQTFENWEDTDTTSDNQIPTGPYPVDNTNATHLKQRAQWIMKIRDGYKLTQSCTENLLSDESTLRTTIMEDIKAIVTTQFQHNPSVIQKVTETLEQPCFSTPFAGLETKHKQMTFIKKNFGYVICTVK